MISEIDQELGALTSPSFSPLPEPLVRDDQSAGPKCEKFVAFFLGEKLFGIRADKVAEVAQPQAVTPLPNALPYLVGITALRGEVIAVIDLSQLLGEVGIQAVGKPKLVVLNSNGTETHVAFPIDRMHEIVSLAPDQIEPDRSLPHIIGLASVSGRILFILDPASLAPVFAVT